MSSPLEYFDPFNIRHVEPSVSGLVRLQETEPVRPDPVNDLIMLGTPRSGQPNVLRDFLKLASIADYHDPDRQADQFVALARTAKTAIAEQDMFGAARIRTVRVGSPTQSERVLKAGATSLISIKTADYGSHTRRSRCLVEPGTTVANSKKITLSDDNPGRTYVGDDLGVLLSIQYTGNGSACALTIRRAGATITFTDQPADTDKVTINGIIFEFDSTGGVTSPNIAVTVGADVDATAAALAVAINANVPGVTADANASNNTVVLSAPQDGVVVSVTSPGLDFSQTPTGAPVNLRTVVTGATDGSADLDLPLSATQFKTIGQLASFINSQLGYTCSVASVRVDKAIPSTGLDVVSSVAIKASAVQLTGYVAAIANWVNTRTQGVYVATVIAPGEPDEDTSGAVGFTGGTTPVVTVTDWEAGLNVLSAGVEKGGVILADTDDPVVQAMITQFIIEQRANGKWFRAVFAAPPATTPAQATTIAGSFDHSNVRLVCQRLGVLDATGTVTYLDPVFFAAAVAGGMCGNRPYVNPLTNKRLRFVGIHPNDDFDQVTRESLLEGGVTVAKSELGTVKISLAVTTSRDPDRRMARIASEIDTLYEIDATIRDRFLKYRGRWADERVVGEALGDLRAVLAEYRRLGALVNGVDPAGNPRSAYQMGSPAVAINAGALEAFYDLFIGGEINHVAIVGGADYQRLVGIETGSNANVAVPIR